MGSETQQFWVLERELNFDESTPVGVFDSEEAAEQAVEREDYEWVAGPFTLNRLRESERRP